MFRTKQRVSRLVLAACLVSVPGISTPASAQALSTNNQIDRSTQHGSGTPIQFTMPSRFTLNEPISSIVSPPPANAFADRGWSREHWHRNSGARTAIIVGSIAAIAGGALLVYANRPGCGAAPSATGCSYGTKVAGGAMLAGGALGITIGALTWR
jgi:hypothetical protein